MFSPNGMAGGVLRPVGLFVATEYEGNVCCDISMMGGVPIGDVSTASIFESTFEFWS